MASLKTFKSIWFLAVLYAIISLLGIDIKGMVMPSGQTSKVVEKVDEVEEPIQQQMQVTDTRKRWKRYDEIQLACAEVDCMEKCSHKVTKKCAKSESCMKSRAKTCKPKCRKQRCETRCKDEPQLGYVEKEMKLEKCKEGCQNDKCKTKCEHSLESCKSKCRGNIHKFKCDRPVEVVPQVDESPDTPEEAESYDGGDDEDTGGNTVEEEENDDELI